MKNYRRCERAQSTIVGQTCIYLKPDYSLGITNTKSIAYAGAGL